MKHVDTVCSVLGHAIPYAALGQKAGRPRQFVVFFTKRLGWVPKAFEEL